jgi:hypothetical protein
MRNLPAIRLPFLAAAAAAVLLTSCIPNLGPNRTIPNVPGTKRVLFIGNSHTYEHDISGMVEKLARLAGDTELQTGRIAEPNWALEDHVTIGIALKALEERDWEFVVMQQGTSAAPASQDHLEFWSNFLEPYIRGAGAEPVMYQIWPHASQRDLAPAALQSYTRAAIAVEGLLAPAGDGFTAALEADPTVVVYAADGLHASKRGAYIAALTILARLIDVDVESLPPEIPGSSIDSTTVRALQRAAAVALARNPARPAVP